MKFWIEIKHGWEIFRYKVEHQVIDERTEHFIIHTRKQNLVISSNRPYFQNHPGLKKRQPIMKLIEGELHNMSFLDKICEALAKWFDKLPIKPV